jgi:hypothetical protein
MNACQRALISVVLFTAAVCFPPGQASAGGWAVATADALPAEITVGQEFVVSFAMRQHGVHLANWGETPLEFIHTGSGRRVLAFASPAQDTLKYTVRVTLPEAGRWRWTVGDGLVQPMGTLTVQGPVLTQVKSRPLAAADLAAADQSAESEVHVGRELFLSKGCVVCHQHEAVAEIRDETLDPISLITPSCPST